MSSGLVCLKCKRVVAPLDRLSSCQCEEPTPSWDNRTPAEAPLAKTRARIYRSGLVKKAREGRPL